MVDHGNNSMFGIGATTTQQQQPMFTEEWKIAGPPPAPQIQQQPQYPETYRIPCTPSKPLPQEPPAPPPRNQTFMTNAVSDAGSWYSSESPYWSGYPPTTSTSNSNDSCLMNYYPQPPTPPDFDHSTIPYEQSFYDDSFVMVEKEDDQSQQHSPKKLSKKKKEKFKKNSKESDNGEEPRQKQFRVQSINKEHVAWINLEIDDTGKILAERICKVATFNTKKITSIVTASGRSLPLDNRPVFGSWMDMDTFQHGETWKVEWGERDKGFFERIFHNFVQVSGSKRD
ncbi:hypothetical protein BDA99DRAFT_144457 [Phascolomyces articulosus]|uniref:Uncharacterized protein n=1 Tax=Phascolomyces articulosus TaxID=60185 RepID=A0AAD5JW14_9FUNG|nr:hypothetical protein BDA99DRAFT_144457 [Phascolomyces articulosus]